MTDYSARDIHRLDQAYPDALADIEAFIGDPKQKARLADKGTEVYAELTRELADTATSPIALAAWAAIATVQLMEAGRVWEEDTDAAWAKVDKLTAERDQAREDAERHRIQMGEADAEVEELREQRDELTTALTQSRAQAATYANEIGTLTAENARLRQQRDDKDALLEAVSGYIGEDGEGESDTWSARELLAGRPTLEYPQGVAR